MLLYKNDSILYLSKIMRKSIIALSIVTASLFASTQVEAKPVVKATYVAACNYSPDDVKVSWDGQQDYKIVCITLSSKGYNVYSYDIGNSNASFKTDSGKNFQHNKFLNRYTDGWKTIFVVRKNDTRSKTVSVPHPLFNKQNPDLGDFGNFFNKR